MLIFFALRISSSWKNVPFLLMSTKQLIFVFYELIANLLNLAQTISIFWYYTSILCHDASHCIIICFKVDDKWPFEVGVSQYNLLHNPWLDFLKGLLLFLIQCKCYIFFYESFNYFKDVGSSQDIVLHQSNHSIEYMKLIFILW